MFGNIIAAYSENQTKPNNKLYGWNVKLLNVKPGGDYSYECALKVETRISFSFYVDV